MITLTKKAAQHETLAARSAMALACIPDAPYKNMLTQLHADMLAADAQQVPPGYTAIDCPQCGFVGCREAQQVVVPDAWDLAEKVWKDLDRRSCPGIYMQIATESIVKHCATPPAPAPASAKPLPEIVIKRLLEDNNLHFGQYAVRLIRAVEAAHGIKEQP